MAITGEHEAAERAFRELLPEAGLPQPDEVEYRDESVVFLWHETKLAVIVDLDGTDADGPPEAVAERQRAAAPRGDRPPTKATGA
jgi:hypothetical protein